MIQQKSINLPPRNNPQFNSKDEFIFGQLMGDGAFAKVYKAIHIRTTTKYAVKVIKLSHLTLGDIENVEKELSIHQNLDSPRIVKLHDFFMEDDIVYVVLELLTKGNLYKYMNKHYPLPESKAIKFWKQVVEGFAYLHDNKVYMRDLKPENIILDENLDTKICDFGWASKLDDTEYLKLKGGTYGYMSPENLQGLIQDLRSDLWSLGVLLFELIHNRLPFRQGISCQEQWEFVQEGKIVYKRGLSSSIKSTIEGLLQIDPSKRLSIEYISEVELVPTTGENSVSSSLSQNLFLGKMINYLQTLSRD